MKRNHLVFLAALLFSPLLLHAADPFLGRWTLDTKRSKYQGISCPKRMIIEMIPAQMGVHYHSETELSNGMTYSADYTASYDGNPVMVSGAKGVLLPVTLRRVATRSHCDIHERL